MEKLNFDPYPIPLKNRENKRYIFDIIRKKDLVFTPEEWVRQHCIHYLIHEKKYPIGLINVEKKIELFGVTKRYDIVVYDRQGQVELLVECKAPTIPIDQKVFDQIAQYNLRLNSRYLMVSNGLQHIFCQLNYAQASYRFLETLPQYRRTQ